MNDNLVIHTDGGVEAVKPMLESRKIISTDLINNPYTIQDDLTS